MVKENSLSHLWVLQLIEKPYVSDSMKLEAITDSHVDLECLPESSPEGIDLQIHS